ncbi:four helix bundle protein [Aequorivita sp. Q41]|uniref:four helix bundle protein n=1 Tax=Aequorivita sp. Q41 TaxID=3153300 RepID=UPI003241C8A9
MRIVGFETLQVWQKTRELSVFVYKETKSFSSEEKFGLISQMRRAVISISSYIAEGRSRHSYNDKARFPEIAYSSALESLNQAMLSNNLGFLSKEKYLLIRKSISKITLMLDGLFKFQIKMSRFNF